MNLHRRVRPGRIAGPSATMCKEVTSRLPSRPLGSAWVCIKHDGDRLTRSSRTNQKRWWRRVDRVLWNKTRPPEDTTDPRSGPMREKGRATAMAKHLGRKHVRNGAFHSGVTPRGDAAAPRPKLPEALAKAPSAGALALKNHFGALLQRRVRARLRRDEPAIIVCPPVAQPVPSGFCSGGLQRHFVLRCVAFPRRPSPLRRRPPPWRPLLL
jgi:hypothetical protein